jgi:hypothetical protein
MLHEYLDVTPEDIAICGWTPRIRIDLCLDAMNSSSAAPSVSRARPLGAVGSSWGWVFVFVPSIVPFGLAALLRGAGDGGMGRAASVVATVVAAALVILGQEAGLSPNDPSSTAVVAVVIVPIYAAVAVLVIWGADNAVAALTKSWRSRKAMNPPA